VFTDTEIARIARIAHEANRAVQAADGDDMPSLPWMWEQRPLRASTIAGVQRVLAGMTLEQNHEMWCEFKRGQGWTWGPEKDPVKKTHPDLVPWAVLNRHARSKARLFAAVVLALSAEE
jgi:hypothetical protein